MDEKIKDWLNSHKTTMICPNCNGTGKGPGVMARLNMFRRNPNGWMVICDVCNGYGRIKRIEEEK